MYINSSTNQCSAVWAKVEQLKIVGKFYNYDHWATCTCISNVAQPTFLTGTIHVHVWKFTHTSHSFRQYITQIVHIMLCTFTYMYNSTIVHVGVTCFACLY